LEATPKDLLGAPANQPERPHLINFSYAGYNLDSAEPLFMENLTPAHELDEAVEFFSFVFDNPNVTAERQEDPDWMIVQADVAVSSGRVNEYIEQKGEETRVKILHGVVGTSADSFLVGCDPAGKVFMVIGQEFYDPRPF
jgi:hypothetical protein